VLPQPIKAIGNLPYYISSPIIQRVIKEHRVFSVLFMTAQLEFGERLVAKPGSQGYGVLSVMAQFRARPKLLFNIGSRSFRPIPKVTSCFIRMDLRPEPAVKVADEALFERVVRQAFLQRRKTVLNSLQSFCPRAELAAVLEKAGISVQARAESLGLEEFARLADGLCGH